MSEEIIRNETSTESPENPGFSVKKRKIDESFLGFSFLFFLFIRFYFSNGRNKSRNIVAHTPHPTPPIKSSKMSFFLSNLFFFLSSMFSFCLLFSKISFFLFFQILLPSFILTVCQSALHSVTAPPKKNNCRA